MRPQWRPKLLPQRLATTLTTVLAWPHTPGRLQLIAATGLGLALFLSLRPSVRAESNVGAGLVWLLWWPLVPLLALAVGRLWCAACPIAGLADLVGRWVPWRRRAPPRWLRRWSGVWLVGTLLLLGIVFLMLAPETSGPVTVTVLALFVMGGAGLALVISGRAWCRYTCPLGAVLGLYAPLGGWRLQPAASALAGYPTSASPLPCPAYLNPRRRIDRRHCQLCARCVGNGVARFVPQRPRPLSTLGTADAALAVTLVGVLAADVVRMTPTFLWYINTALAVLAPLGPVAYKGAVALLPVLGALLAAGLVAGLGLRRPGSWQQGAAALIPAALATHVALSLQHLAGSAIPTAQALAVELLPIPWAGHVPPLEAYSVVPWLKVVQLTIFALAVLVALRRPSAPRLAALGAPVGLGAFFILPMSLAC